MQTDVRGLTITAADPRTAAALDATIEAYCGFRLDTGDRLKELLAIEFRFALGHILRGYFMLLFGRRDFVPKAERSLEEACRLIEGATPRERAHLEALRRWTQGDLKRAIGWWEKILEEAPRDLLALKLAQHGHFYLGDAGAMRASVERALKAWAPEVPGYGYVLGCRAFGLEETGDYLDAERVGREAVRCNPADAWAGHAVAHVMEMQDRLDEGLTWIGEQESGWSAVNNFIFHVHWHRCLFLLAKGRYDEVLERYDREVRAESTEDQFDISNAVSLLWRLEQLGVDIGDRWAELAARSVAHLADHCLVFADMHYVMALAAIGDTSALDAWRKSARSFCDSSRETAAKIMAEVGLDLGEAVIAHRQGEWSRVVDILALKEVEVRSIGGSHAQRDLFHRLLIDAAIKAGRSEIGKSLLEKRRQARPQETWGRTQMARLLV